MKARLSRRETLQRILLGSAGASLGASATLRPTEAAPAAEPQGVCTLYPQSVEGPFYFDPNLVRSDITAGSPGTPIALALRVIEAGSCTPIENARVDLWHADARGVYSGYPGQGDDRRTSAKGESYLRGTQFTDSKGEVTFRSVYPGWYPGRTPHIHVKVFLDEKTLATGQMYFPDDVSAKVYTSEKAYAPRGTADTTNGTDFLFRTGGPDGGGTVLLVNQGQPDGIMQGSLVIAVDRTGEAAKGGWRSFFR